MEAEKQEKYQIYIDRNDGAGLALDGCWGSEDAAFTNEAAGREALQHLATVYPDADWVLCDPEGNEVARIAATDTE